MKNLITFEEAFEKAKMRSKKYNECAEYSDGWYFYENNGVEMTGGDIGVVILKSGGDMVSPTLYFMSGKYDAENLDNTIKC